MVEDGPSAGLPADEPELPLVGIGIPVRNGADHLAEALQSVLAQDYPRFEVVVCDNASDDGTEQVARRFAEADSRVRYVRNGKDLGFLPNFRKALELTSGRYFTWLAHDDLLSDPAYLRRTVAHLEAHPETVCCSTAFRLTGFELAGEEVMAFPRLHPDRWPSGRRELFRWPHGWVDLTIYGVFRREPLVSVPMPQRSYRGRPHIFWWETEVLTDLSAAGPIVALPEPLRTYRRAAVSAGHAAVTAVSPLDMTVLGMQITLLLLGKALRLPAPPGEKLPLIATTSANLVRTLVRRPFDLSREIRALEEQALQLQRTASERARLASSLRGVVAERRHAARTAGPGDVAGEAEMTPGPVQRPAAPPKRGRLARFFRPPPPAEVDYHLALIGHVARMRSLAGRHLEQVEALHSEAERLQEAMQAAGSSPTGPPLVSVGMPVYNGEEQLAAAVESVLAQDYPNLEVVLVDNASTDGTEAVCRRFAETDPRVRYLRNESNIGFLPNFRRALDESRGRYFTWLAHDDYLTEPSYLSTVVAHMEANPGTVCCHTAFDLIDNELKGSVERMSFPELAPESSPAQARRELFRWPHGWLDSVIYGVFRRSEIARIRFPEWTYRGRPHIFCWEMDVLTALSGRGRIVALPQSLRAYRLSTVSVGKQIGESVSSFDLLLLGLRMKAILLRRALTQPAGPMERAGLVATTIGNLFRANFRQPYDHRTVLYRRQRELSMLQRTAAERAELIAFLRKEIEARKRIVAEMGAAPGPSPPPVEDPGAVPEAPPPARRGMYSLLRDFFRPLPAEQVRRLYELSEEIGSLRKLCDRQESAIAALTAEAQRWLDLIDTGSASSRT